MTISTNMAGRGTDIVLGGDRVVALGGLYVIGTNRHEARRIDYQLRGRAGRQGDPGCSRFFVSLEDDLLVRYGIDDLQDLDHAQRVIEGQHLEIRQTLWKYEGILESQRQVIHQLRRETLLAAPPDSLRLSQIDELWSDYLASVTELRDGIHWQSLAGKDPVSEFRKTVVTWFDDLLDRLEDEVASADTPHLDTSATWTYLTTDQPFGTLAERLSRGLKRKWTARRLWG